LARQLQKYQISVYAKQFKLLEDLNAVEEISSGMWWLKTVESPPHGEVDLYDSLLGLNIG